MTWQDTGAYDGSRWQSIKLHYIGCPWHGKTQEHMMGADDSVENYIILGAHDMARHRSIWWEQMTVYKTTLYWVPMTWQDCCVSHSAYVITRHNYDDSNRSCFITLTLRVRYIMTTDPWPGVYPGVYVYTVAPSGASRNISPLTETHTEVDHVTSPLLRKLTQS